MRLRRRGCRRRGSMRVDEFSVGDGGFDDVADGVDSMREGCAVVDGGFEGKFHAGGQGGVPGDLMCERREDRCQLLPCRAVRTGRQCFADGLGEGVVPNPRLGVRRSLLGWEVFVHRAFGEFSGTTDGVDAGVTVSVGVEMLGGDGDDRFSCSTVRCWARSSCYRGGGRCGLGSFGGSAFRAAGACAGSVVLFTGTLLRPCGWRQDRLPATSAVDRPLV